MKTILFNPIKKYQENKLLIIGIIATLLGSCLAYVFNARFDGIIDIHFVESINFWQPLLDNLINISLLSILLFFLGIYINKKTRFIDILNSSLISRIPLCFVPIFNTGTTIEKINTTLLNTLTTDKIPDLSSIPVSFFIILTIFSLVSILILIWSIALLHNGYKVATNAKEIKHIVLFFMCVIVAEIISKILITNLPY
ncbi:hypothetical protein KO500_16640 [Cellulophaga baltica]|uniref:hypothetical protein n=1 Tax=Cellulophaga TaxID=104264 RepID=UPI001C07ADEA|nr:MULTISPECIES: hypothetical protein [Cellulophaga]MBU2998071.1 hypothetical protein [Cellulophaga baltica]MDO6769473.1 hypothetical protein [Cellulophaga sp. 1_MG-2023]